MACNQGAHTLWLLYELPLRYLLLFSLLPSRFDFRSSFPLRLSFELSGEDDPPLPFPRLRRCLCSLPSRSELRERELLLSLELSRLPDRP